MPEVAETPLEDENLGGDETTVDAAIRAAGGERQAIRALLVALDESRAALAATSSLGYPRGCQPRRPLR